MPVQRNRIRRFSGQCLIVLFCLWPAIIHAGGLGFAPLVILMGVVGWVVWASLDPDSLSDLRLIGPLMLFVLWMGISGFWSGYGPMTALRLALQFVLMAAIPVLILHQSQRRIIMLSHLVMATALAGVAIIVLDVGSGYALNMLIDPVGLDGDLNRRQGDAEMNIGRGLLSYALFTPLLIGLFGSYLKRDLAIVAIVLFLFGLLLGSYLNRLWVPFLILLGALPLFWLGYRKPDLGRMISLCTAVGSILFAPLIGFFSRLMPESALSGLPMSWDHRLRMWDYALAKIQDKPFWGHGLDSSRAMQDDFTTRIGVDVPFISLHPHNIGLQTWMELGAIGALLMGLVIVSLSRPLQRYTDGSPWRSGAVAGGIMAISLAGMTTVGAWQYWWWGAALLVIFLIPLIPSTRRVPPPIGTYQSLFATP